MACSTNTDENIDKAIELVIKASNEGANIILIQELFGNIITPNLVRYNLRGKAQTNV